MRGGWLAIALALQGCAIAVQARGPVTPGPTGPVITGLNGKSRVLDPGAHAVLRALDGHLVELEGILRKGVVHVTEADIEEGPLGLPVFVGRVRVDPRGDVWVDDGTTGASYRITGELDDAVAEVAGEVVVVEGIVAGRMGVQAMGVRVVR